MLNRLLFGFALAILPTAALADVPVALRPPSPATSIGSFHAAGLQIYDCGPDGHWELKAPEAELSNEEGKRVIHHFAGPTWQATDGSKIVGTLLAKVPAPDADAIPWLLVAAKPSGPGLLGNVRYVQRLDTIGGAAPAGACKAGETQSVPYTATYTFFR